MSLKAPFLLIDVNKWIILVCLNLARDLYTGALLTNSSFASMDLFARLKVKTIQAFIICHAGVCYFKYMEANQFTV